MNSNYTKSHSVQFSRSVMSDSLWTYESQHARPPCTSPKLMSTVYSTHVHWVGDAIQPSHPLSSPSPRLQSFPASGSFQMSQLFTPDGQSIGVSALASVLAVNIQDWFLLGWTGWISLQSKGISRVFSNNTVRKHQFSALSFLYSPTLTSIHDYWENHSFD